VWYPWTLPVLLAFGLIAWIVVAERPKEKSSLRLEVSPALTADPDLRFISERNPYMRTKR
jgi:hypothetical protein